MVQVTRLGGSSSAESALGRGLQDPSKAVHTATSQTMPLNSQEPPSQVGQVGQGEAAISRRRLQLLNQCCTPVADEGHLVAGLQNGR